jgi:hypothetical protein
MYYLLISPELLVKFGKDVYVWIVVAHHRSHISQQPYLSDPLSSPNTKGDEPGGVKPDGLFVC